MYLKKYYNLSIDRTRSNKIILFKYIIEKKILNKPNLKTKT